MTAIDIVLAVATAEVGYLEKKSNAQLDSKTANAGSNNYTKYARDLDAIKGFYNGTKQGASWCDVFVDWCFVTPFGAEVARKMLCQPPGSCGAGVKYSAQYYQAAGRFFANRPQVGDQIFFITRKGLTITSWLHTGLVVGVDGTYVYTIEGNTSGASGVVNNGGGVCRKKYRLDSNSIGGYGRPRWELAKAQDKEEVEMTKDEVKKMIQAEVEAATAKLTPTRYHKVSELPAWAQSKVRRLIDAGIISGDGTHEISLTDADLVMVSMLDKVLLLMMG